MNIEQLVIFIVIGAVAGWLAGVIMKGSGMGLVPNIIVGWVGSFIGAAVFHFLGFSSSGIIGAIITATVGASLLLLLISVIKKA